MGRKMTNIQRYNVIVSDRARQMMGTHIRFLANVSKAAARKTKNELVKAFCSLDRTPERFPFFDAIYIPPNKYHKMYVERWYLVLYQVRDSTVYVDYVLDCRQDYGWLAK